MIPLPSLLVDHDVALFIAGASIFTFAMLLSITVAIIDDRRMIRYQQDIHARHIQNLRAVNALFQDRRALRKPGAHRQPYRPQPMYAAGPNTPTRASTPPPAHIELTLTGVET